MLTSGDKHDNAHENEYACASDVVYYVNEEGVKDNSLHDNNESHTEEKVGYVNLALPPQRDDYLNPIDSLVNQSVDNRHEVNETCEQIDDQNTMDIKNPQRKRLSLPKTDICLLESESQQYTGNGKRNICLVSFIVLNFICLLIAQTVVYVQLNGSMEDNLDEIQPRQLVIQNKQEAFKTQQQGLQTQLKELNKTQQYIKTNQQEFQTAQLELQTTQKDFQNQLQTLHTKQQELPAQKQEFQDEMQEFQTQMQDLQSRMISFEIQQQAFQNQTQEFQSQQQDFQRQQQEFQQMQANLTTCSSKVAFMAALFDGFINNKRTFEGNTTVVYDDVITNYGNGYDETTGVFTCAVPGLYSFHTHALNSNENLVRLNMKHNSTIVASLFAGWATKYEADSVSAVVDMLVGDVVTIETALTFSTFHKEAYIPRTNVFSGYLVRADGC